jgi:hypothetical protein
VRIEAHWWPACGPTGPEVSFTITALGEFDRDPTTVDLATEGAGLSPLGLPPSTEAVEVHATDGFRWWFGRSAVDGGASVDVSLWPAGSTCPLYEGTSYPPGNGEGLGIARGGTLLVFGGGQTTASSTGALLAHLHEASTASPRLDPRARRSGATVSAFGPHLLVAGGTDPLASDAPLATAEVLDIETLRFEATSVDLSTPRREHGAVTLASDDVLLVGGLDPDGVPLRTLEVVSVATRRYQIEGLTDLSVARRAPQVIRLDDDRIVVAGGSDREGRSVSAIEWLSPDARRTLTLLDSLTPGRLVRARAFAAMPGGGALAVGGCDTTTPAPDGDPSCVEMCGVEGGCPTREVFWIDAHARVAELPLLPVPAPRPQLLAGTEGRPWLSTGGPRSQWLLFDPWTSTFRTAPGAPPEAPTSRGRAIAAPGTLLWLEDGPPPRLVGFRHSVRGDLTSEAAPLVLSGMAALVPTRAVGVGVYFDEDDAALVLDDPDAAVRVADARYRAISLEITSTGPAPIVYVGSDAYGDERCPWPDRGAAGTRRLVRLGDEVTLEGGGEQRTCAASSEKRTFLGIATPGPALRITSLLVRRGAIE